MSSHVRFQAALSKRGRFPHYDTTSSVTAQLTSFGAAEQKRG
ncbi:MAG: hypothetical protein ACR2H3_06070 [Acidimicrobiales bacterium]